FKIKEEEGRKLIFDAIRKSWMVLTPEEWVRQNFIQYLTEVKQYPSSLIAIEKEILLGELVKRFDILVYDKDHKPWMIIECKGMESPLDESTLEQALRYNISVPVPHLVITNGSYTFAFRKNETALEMLEELPPFTGYL
ncbi:MAG TPA: type I restriction enzyme HsdR N-terminal domain-containing protein, partial [Chitinophagaceae bacterium]|nr:type I restriction enzyme HsdR N-terminal domain-containing protein [Chitinophagaceae bacterium]